jgi:hypothetical protein
VMSCVVPIQVFETDAAQAEWNGAVPNPVIVDASKTPATNLSQAARQACVYALLVLV